MYPRNTASPRTIHAKVTKASDGSPIITGVECFHIEGTTRTAADNAETHVANGLWAYTPSQAETNFDAFSIEFYHADAVCDGPVVEILTNTLTTEILYTALTESYSTAGAAPTLAQAVFELLAMRETQIVDTTRTAYELDGSTAAMTFTLTLDTDGKPYKQERAT